MCGIVGIALHHGDAAAIAGARTASALASLRHRGPDFAAEYRQGPVWLGHTRLTILDLSSAGNQPMATADGQYVIIYNGEVYNFRELASELSLRDLRSTSDTEVVLRAFALSGAASFQKLNGMFAFAVYDRQAQKIWLVRDRLGIKPLYYLIDDERLIFGSEIKAIIALLDQRPPCAAFLLHEWLYYGNTLGGRTLYRGIRQLEPGRYLELDLRSFSHHVDSYWSLAAHAGRRKTAVSISDAVSETRRLFEAAVRRQLVSDVPVGVFLSGGVDSSAITAVASKYYGGRLTTYSVGFDDRNGVDERPKARRVAKYFGTDHHEFLLSGPDLKDLLPKMVRQHDMPFSDAANIPLYRMAAEISGHIKVVLQGDGGDEVFGGYRRYTTLKYASLIRPLAKATNGLNGGLPNSWFFRRVKRYLHAYGASDISDTMARLLTPVDPETLPDAVFSTEFRQVLSRSDPFARYRECQRLFSDRDLSNQMLLVDLLIELPDVFLEKVDRATMAASLEVRVPFLDHDLVEYVTMLPGSLKVPFGRKKWLLKKALRGTVPNDILDAPKTGFNVPFCHWLRTSLKSPFFDHLAQFERERPGVLDPHAVRRMFTAMEKGEYDRSNTLWNVLNLMIWSNQAGVTFAA